MRRQTRAAAAAGSPRVPAESVPPPHAAAGTPETPPSDAPAGEDDRGSATGAPRRGWSHIGKLGFDGLLLFRVGENLLVFNPRIALQRIWYERTLARFRKAERRSQALLIPEPMEFEPVLADVLLKNMATLEAAGFAVEEFGRNFFRVTEIPDWLSLSADVRMFVRDLVDRIARLPAEFSRGNVAHDAIARIAAAQAARNREAFSDEEIPALLDELFATAQPNVGPNGQKVFFEISRAEIARRLQ